MANRLQIASVTSKGHPLDGQEHRSSGNFSTDGVPDGYHSLTWEITDVEDPNNVTFDVMRDKFGSDPTEYPDLTNGRTTGVKKERSLYIANPGGSFGKDFLVTVYAEV